MALVIDHSTLSAFTKCNLQALIRYHHGLTTPGERAELLNGQAVAQALAASRRGAPQVEAIAQYAQVYRAWAEANIPENRDADLYRLSWNNARRVFLHYLQHHTPEQVPYTWQPEHVEVGFRLPLDEHGDIEFVGRLDLLCTFNGQWHVLDDKTCGSLTSWWERQWLNAAQWRGYAWAAQQLGIPVEGALINAIEFKAIPDSDRRCSTHGMSYSECGTAHLGMKLLGPYPCDPPALTAWREQALHFALEYKKLCEALPALPAVDLCPKQGEWNGSCRFCAYIEHCLVGPQPALLKTNLVESRWDPLAAAESQLRNLVE